MLQLLLISLLQQNSGTQIDASESEEQEEKDDRVSDDEEQKGEEYEGNQYGSFVLVHQIRKCLYTSGLCAKCPQTFAVTYGART
jgi:hypothetical protein